MWRKGKKTGRGRGRGEKEEKGEGVTACLTRSLAGLTDILPNKAGEEFMSEVLSTELETKTLGRVMYPELSVG